MNLLIQFTNIAFAAVLEAAPTPTGPWSPVATNVAACPCRHVFPVEASGPAQFYRGKFLDNGIEPTPETVTADKTPRGIAVATPLAFRCDDTQAGPTEYWRSMNGAPFVLVTVTTRSGILDTNLPPGRYTYRARIAGGLFAEAQPTVTIEGN